MLISLNDGTFESSIGALPFLQTSQLLNGFFSLTMVFRLASSGSIFIFGVLVTTNLTRALLVTPSSIKCLNVFVLSISELISLFSIRRTLAKLSLCEWTLSTTGDLHRMSIE